MSTINQFFGATSKIGGTDGDIDNIAGGSVVAADGCVLIDTDETAGLYTLSAASGATESSPSIIKPDDDAGTKRWLLTTILGMGVKVCELSANPSEPAEGTCVIWMSDGTGAMHGDDGDVMIASQAGGVTKYGTLFDHSGGGAW